MDEGSDESVSVEQRRHFFFPVKKMFRETDRAQGASESTRASTKEQQRTVHTF